MNFTKQLVTFVAMLALLVVSISTVSAFADITDVEVSGVSNAQAPSTQLSVTAGQVIPVRVIFRATGNETDVRVKAWIAGSRDYSVSSERFDVIAGNIYSRLVAVQVPSNIDPDEEFTLYVSVEGTTEADREDVELTAQRESYTVEILDIVMEPQVNAGEQMALDIVLKNRGRQLAEDTFVRVSIPALNIERRVYFGDLSSVDQADPDKEDAAERRMYVNIPANAPAGIYAVQIDAYNADSVTSVTKKIAVAGASASSTIVSANAVKSFDADEKASYTVTVVNSGNKVRVYDVSFEAPSGLTLVADEPVFAVPSGASKTVTVQASAEKAGKYTFVVNVNSEGQLVNRESFVANVEGNAGSSATVVLTVILAIIFIVLLVVLIVLLTKKPQKNEEFGESYY